MSNNCKVLGGEVSERLQNIFFDNGFFYGVNQLFERVRALDPALAGDLESEVNATIGAAADRGFIVGLRVARDPALVLLVEG